MERKRLSREVVVAAGAHIKEREYWLEVLANAPEKAVFFPDFRQAGGRESPTGVMSTASFILDGPGFEGLVKLSNRSDYSLHIILVAVVYVLVHRYINHEDLLIVTPIYRQEYEKNLLNTLLPIRCQVQGEMTFKDVLLQAKAAVLKALENQAFPIELVLEKLAVSIPEQGEFPLTSISLVLENIQNESYLEPFVFKNLFSFVRHETALEVRLRYAREWYSESTIQQIMEHFSQLLNMVSIHIDWRIKEIDFLSDREKEQLLRTFNNTESPYPRHQTIAGLFHEQVQRFCDRIAVFGEGLHDSQPDLSISFVALDILSDQLARKLRACGVTHGAIVGVMLERSVEMAVAVLGIIKAGSAYLPISPYYPEPRKKYIMTDSHIHFLVTTRHWLPGDYRGYEGVQVLDIKDISQTSPGENQGMFDKTGEENRLAYIIYTSGSTGMSKGVMVEHHNVIRLVCNTSFVDFQESDRLLQTGALEFDASTFEIWGALLNGLGLCLLGREKILSPQELKTVILRFGITMMWMTAPLFNQMQQEDMDIFRSLRVLIVGGDVLSPVHINALVKRYRGLTLINGYGPTENTTFSTTYQVKCECEGNIPIGRPITHSTVYIFDRYDRLTPLGAVGELIVGGDGVSRGYLNNQELTVDKFFYNPYKKEERLYRTGDMARWLPDGNIEFLGRKDQQIKIRGFRIELNEIKNSLLKYPRVRDAVVVSRTDPSGDKFLCAYYTVQKEKNSGVSANDLKDFLSSSLPDFMVPSFLIEVREIPLTPNGKVDIKALPELSHTPGEMEFTAPRDEVEKQLAEIWHEVLNIDLERISIDDHFFKSGGHSLKAVRMISRVHKVFHVMIPLEEIFQLAVIRKLADFIRRALPRAFVSIPPVEERGNYPLSPAQRRIFILDQLEEQSIVYNIPAIWQWQGTIERERLENAFGQLIERHESFRTSFRVVGDEPVQEIHLTVDFSIQYNYHPVDVQKEIKGFVQPFNLSQAPLLRVGLMTLADESHFLIVDMHHIISDGVSYEIFQRELVTAYQGKALPVLPLRYRDFACWQVQRFQEPVMDIHKEYWLKMFAGELPVLDLPYDFTRPMVQSFEGNILGFSLDGESSSRLRNLADREEVTLFILVLSLFYGWLMRLSGCEDMVVGTPVAGRNHADLENIIGMFVNTLVIRSFPGYKKSFRHFLQEVKEQTLSAFSHQDYQFEELVEQVVEHRDTSRNPLFDVMFTMKTLENIGVVKKEKTSNSIRLEHTIAKFDLTLNAVDDSAVIFFTFEYCTRLFKKETLERFSHYFSRLAAAVGVNPDVIMGEIDLMSGEEKKQILFHFNDSGTAYPRQKTIQRLFEEQVETGPDRIALVVNEPVDKNIPLGETWEHHFTYCDLNRRVNQVAHLLREKGVKPDDIVGLKVERSGKMMEGILGILKAGGAYLPIESTFPQARVDFMFKDASIRLLVTQSPFNEKEHYRLELDILDLDSEAINQQSSLNPVPVGNAGNLVYVIYTSGTTGNPKGTLTTHANAVRIVRNTNFTCLTSQDRMMQLSNYAFDGSIFDTFGALLNGGTLVMIERERLLVFDRLADWIERQQVTGFFITAALFNTLVDLKIDCFRHVTRIIVGGERLSVFHIKRAFEFLGQGRLINGYGPTETTVFATYYPIDKISDLDNSVPIGRPVANTSVYIFDRVLSPVPLGIIGEIYVGGDGVARGYLNRPELTGEKFISMEFPDGYKQILYKTGDLGRWMADGNIEFFGRLDHQVKIRGFRIELGEIEARLSERNDIKEAVVLARTNAGGDSFLCAYIVPAQNSPVPAMAELKKYLAQSLPEYMIPVYIVKLESMPLTANGKIDRNRLPEPEMVSSSVYEAPTNDIERELTKIWAAVLGIAQEKIGVKDSFFDLGGQSLKATLLIARVHERFAVKLLLTDIFTAPFIQELAARIGKAKPEHFHGIEPAEKKEYFPMSPAQRRLYIVHRMSPGSTSYNMPLMVIMEGELDVSRLETAVRLLINRHDVLRTAFIEINFQPVQLIMDEANFKVNLLDLQGTANPGVVMKTIKEFIQPFDLAHPPYLRVGIIKIAPQKHVFMIDMHHIISDGASHEIFLREITALYMGQTLPPLTIQYNDFSQWMNQRIEAGQMDKEERFWLEQFKGDITRLKLPFDFPRPDERTNEGASVVFYLLPGQGDQLKQLASENSATLFMVILSLFYILLAKVTFQEDIVIGTVIAGRRYSELERLIGMFVNTLALRAYPGSEKSFIVFFREVKHSTLAAFDHQDYQFDELVEKLQVPRDTGRNPLFDILFSFNPANYKTFQEKLADVQGPGFTVKPFGEGSSQVKFDLLFSGGDNGQDLFFVFEYSKELFKPETITRFIKYFKEIVTAVVEDKNIIIKDISISHDLTVAISNVYKEQDSDFEF